MVSILLIRHVREPYLGHRPHRIYLLVRREFWGEDWPLEGSLYIRHLVGPSAGQKADAQQGLEGGSEENCDAITTGGVVGTLGQQETKIASIRLCVCIHFDKLRVRRR